MMRSPLIVFRKEILDNLRDRRTLWSALVFGPLFGPVLFAMLINIQLDRALSKIDEPLELPVSGAEFAPNLIQFLQESNTTILPAPPSAEDAVKARLHDVVLVIPDSYAERFRDGEPAVVRLVADRSNNEAQRQLARARGLLARYSNKIGAMRLQVRGVSPMVSHPIVVEDIDVSTPQGRSVLVLGIMTYFVLFAMLSGGMPMAIDTTAGERERGSLEPLLALPARRPQILAGKLAATCLFMTLSLMITLAAFAISLNFVQLEKLGMSANFGPDVAVKVFLIAWPFVLLGGGLMTFVATFTKSYKEAQTYLTAVLLVPTIPIIFASIYEVQAKLELMAIPSLSQHLLITELLKGNELNPAWVAVSVGSTLLFGLVLAFLAAKRYESEKILG